MATITAETFTQFITDAPAATPPSIGDLVPIIQGGATKHIAASAFAGGGLFVIVTSGATYNVLPGDGFIEVKKSVGSATTINLPSSPSTNQQVIVKDGNGDAALHPITITNGTIDGETSVLLSAPYGSVTVKYDGTHWSQT